MRANIISGIAGLVLGAVAVLGISAVLDAGRDSCAKLADLESATSIGDDRQMFLAVLDMDDSLLRDCLTD